MTGPIPETRLRELLHPFLQPPDGSVPHLPPDTFERLLLYLDLLLRWNARTNLTAIRNPEEIVTRHFGESLFTGLSLSTYITLGSSLLDLGSGAGFPGIPVQVLYPELHVTLAESQGKKAAFLREVVRSLGLPSEIWAARAELMPEARRFQIVTLRAVDCMADAMQVASQRLTEEGILAELATSEVANPNLLVPVAKFTVPASHERTLRFWSKS